MILLFSSLSKYWSLNMWHEPSTASFPPWFCRWQSSVRHSDPKRTACIWVSKHLPSELSEQLSHVQISASSRQDFKSRNINSDNNHTPICYSFHLFYSILVYSILFYSFFIVCAPGRKQLRPPTQASSLGELRTVHLLCPWLIHEQHLHLMLATSTFYLTWTKDPVNWLYGIAPLPSYK